MSAVTTVVAAVCHHYLARTRARLQRLRRGVDGDGAAGRGIKWRPPRWRGLAGGAALVGGTAVATLAAVQVAGPTPLGKLFASDNQAQPRPVIKVVEGDGRGPGRGGDATPNDEGTNEGPTGPQPQGGDSSPDAEPDRRRDVRTASRRVADPTETPTREPTPAAADDGGSPTEDQEATPTPTAESGEPGTSAPAPTVDASGDPSGDTSEQPSDGNPEQNGENVTREDRTRR